MGENQSLSRVSAVPDLTHSTVPVYKLGRQGYGTQK